MTYEWLMEKLYALQHGHYGDIAQDILDEHEKDLAALKEENEQLRSREQFQYGNKVQRTEAWIDALEENKKLKEQLEAMAGALEAIQKRYWSVSSLSSAEAAGDMRHIASKALNAYRAQKKEKGQ